MDEFGLIDKLRHLAQNRAEAQGFLNDAAVLAVPEGKELVITSDCATSGVHFLPGQSPGSIAQKALRRNVSDLYAMGAEGLCYQMCLLLPQMDEPWLEGFIAGLAADQKRYGLFLSGGDVSSTPGPLSIVITAFGLVDAGKAWSRAGAKAGDLLVLSGPVGDAVCGLKALREGLDEPAFISAYQTPEVKAAPAGLLPHAAIDISDGLAQDVGHLCAASGLSAVIDVNTMQFSGAVNAWLARGLTDISTLLSGGDDYVLALAMPSGSAIPKEFQVIGRFENGPPEVRVTRGGQPLELTKKGWRHF